MTRMRETSRWLRAAPPALVALAAAGVAAGQSQPSRQGLLSLDGAQLFYEVVGTGDPIIVIHGGPAMDHNYLRPGLDVLASSHSLVYYDQRGTGRSSADLDSAHVNLDVLVTDVDQLRQALGYDRVTVLAHSFGALIGLEYARRYPEFTRALILMDPVEPGSRWLAETQKRQQAARTPEDSAQIAELTGSEAFKARDPATVSEVFRLAFRSEFRDPSREASLALTLSRRTARDGPKVAELLGKSIGDLDWWDRLWQIQTPTLVVQGKYDLTPMAMARALSDSLPVARLAVLDSGHFPYIEDAPGLTSAISVFLADLQR